MEKSSVPLRGPLIVCMGPSQLVAGIEALKLSDFPLTGAQFIYAGTYNESLDSFFHEVAVCFDIEYITPPLPVQLSHPLDTPSGVDFRSIRWLFDYRKLLNNYSLKIRNDWDRLQNRVTVISVRHTVENDVVLLSILRPSKTILTADGVVLDFIPRSLTGRKWQPLDDTLKKLPLDKIIWSPPYLAENVSSYATPSMIPTSALRHAFDAIRSTPLGEDLQLWLNSLLVPPKSILISQQFAQSGLMTRAQEVEMISNFLEELGERGLTPVLIKPHPRDDLCKLQEIDNLLSEKACVEGYLVPEEYAAVPAETLGLCLGTDLVASIGWASTALLGLNAITGCDLLLINPPGDSQKLASQCGEFKLLVQKNEQLNLGG